MLGVGNEDAFATVLDRLESQPELLFGPAPLGDIGKGQDHAPARVVADTQARGVDLGPADLAVARTDTDDGVTDFIAFAQGHA